MKESALEKAIKRVEAIEGMNIRDAVELRYIKEERSYRYLCPLWRIDNRTVAKLIAYAGFSARHGSAAVKTQWKGADERRKATGKMLASINHAAALSGNHVRQGVNKSNSDLMRRVADKLKTNSSFFRPDVKAKALRHSLESRAKHPERMSALRLSPSACESIVAGFLDGKGIAYEFRKLVGRYVVDFFLPNRRLAIDCMGASRFPLSYQRHKSITQEGVKVVYCVNPFVKRADFGDLYDYITRCDAVGLDPTHRCEDTVIWGARGLRPFGPETNQFSCERSYMGGFHKLVLTAAPDNPVSEADILDILP